MEQGLGNPLALAWALSRAHRGGVASIASRQQTRLNTLVTRARAHSPCFRRLNSGVREGNLALINLPVVTESALMARYNEWVTELVAQSGCTARSSSHAVGDPRVRHRCAQSAP